MRLAAIVLLVTLGFPATGRAQLYRTSVLWVAPDSAVARATMPGDSSRVFHPPQAPEFDPKAGEPSIAVPIVGSLLCGAALGIAGGLIGDSADPGYDDDIPIGALSGYFIGETIGVPIGAHLGNARRGNLAGDLGISILGHLAALGLGSLGGGAGYVAGLSVQILATTINEQKVGRKRAAAKHERELAAQAAKSP